MNTFTNRETAPSYLVKTMLWTESDRCEFDDGGVVLSPITRKSVIDEYEFCIIEEASEEVIYSASHYDAHEYFFYLVDHVAELLDCEVDHTDE